MFICRLVILKLPFSLPPPSDQVKNLGKFTSMRQERGHPMGERKPIRKTAANHTAVSEHAEANRGH